MAPHRDAGDDTTVLEATQHRQNNTAGEDVTQNNGARGRCSLSTSNFLEKSLLKNAFLTSGVSDFLSSLASAAAATTTSPHVPMAALAPLPDGWEERRDEYVRIILEIAPPLRSCRSPLVALVTAPLLFARARGAKSGGLRTAAGNSLFLV